MKKDEKYILVLSESLSEVPERIKIIPLGNVKSEKGSFVVSTESFSLIEAKMKERGLDIVIDYEHQTLNDVQAPAAGWIKSLALTEDSIVAEVEWTSKGAEYLKNKEYRYLSPVIGVRKSDGVAVSLHSVALTNTPAIDGMFPLVLKNNESEEIGMKYLKDIAEKLGLSITEDKSDEEIAQAIYEALPEPSADPAAELVANKTILNLLNLTEDAKVEDVSAAILSLKSTDGKGNWKELYDELKMRMDKQDAHDLVLQALKAGKIHKDQKEWAQEYALKDRQSFEKFLDKAPQVVPLGEIEAGTPTGKNTIYDEETSIICKAMGMSKEDIEKYGKDVE